MPGVPTVAASGYPGFEAWAWQGFAAPAATPDAVVAKLQASYVAAIKDPEIVTKLTGAGIDILQSTPADFAAYMRSETAKWDKVVKTANIRAD